VAFLDGVSLLNQIGFQILYYSIQNEIYKAGLVETQADGIEGIGTG